MSSKSNNDVNNDTISSAGFISRASGRLLSRSGKEEGKGGDDLNVRVRERNTTSGSEERPRTRLGSFLSKRGGGGSGANDNAGIHSIVGNNNSSGTSSIEKKASEIKEQLKRPLSSLFRRTQSNERSQQQQQSTGGGITISNKQGISIGNNLSHNQQPSATPPIFANKSNKTNRAPSAIGGRSTTLITGMGTSTENADINPNNDNNLKSLAANGLAGNVASATANISTTATRPFTGFSGSKREAIKQNDEINTKMMIEMDLSEQAAIAPSMRRFSGFSAADPSSSLFIMKQQKQQRQQQTLNNKDVENGVEIEDVNFLSRFLCPEDEIQDENIPWTWDSLFASVTSELREEWALEEEAANSGGSIVADGGIPGGGIQTGHLKN